MSISAAPESPPLGSPRLHLRLTGSTNDRARELASGRAPHGTLVTATRQSAGRGRQGRTWVAPPGRALLCSLVLREPPRLLPLIGGIAVAEVAERVAPPDVQAQLKWPNDVLLGGRKVAGILVEGRPQERWAVLGIGLNVAVREHDLPAELRARAGGLGLEPEAVESVLAGLLAGLTGWLRASEWAVLQAVRARDALLDRPLHWAGGSGRGAGIDGDGRLVVLTPGGRTALRAGEVHLGGA
jgi:BirA family transcriptional regulator, biotin operon repressor / biotin---[acetyl-CoA-carboxylase] ligase